MNDKYTKDQIASIMLQYGTEKQKMEAIAYARGITEPSEHIEKVKKVWGMERILVNTELYCAKFLDFDPEWMCSLHYHKIKDETFMMFFGKAILIVETPYDKLCPKIIVPMELYKRYRITPKTYHQVIALDSTSILEISTHHEDSDSYRIEDNLSRKLTQDEFQMIKEKYYKKD